MLAAKEEKRELCRREWAERIAECESSNMSVREWCAANGMNVNTYYGRVAALKKDTAKTKKTPTQDIVPLSAVKEKPDVPSAVKSETVAVPIRKPVHEKERVILRKEDIEIILPPDISESMILLLLRGLKEC